MQLCDVAHRIWRWRSPPSGRKPTSNSRRTAVKSPASTSSHSLMNRCVLERHAMTSQCSIQMYLYKRVACWVSLAKKLWAKLKPSTCKNNNPWRHIVFHIQEWKLHSHVETWKRLTTRIYHNSKYKHPAISTSCRASRRPGFYVWNIFLVMVCTDWVEPGNLNSKRQFLITFRQYPASTEHVHHSAFQRFMCSMVFTEQAHCFGFQLICIRAVHLLSSYIVHCIYVPAVHL